VSARRQRPLDRADEDRRTRRRRRLDAAVPRVLHDGGILPSRARRGRERPLRLDRSDGAPRLSGPGSVPGPPPPARRECREAWQRRTAVEPDAGRGWIRRLGRSAAERAAAVRHRHSASGDAWRSRRYRRLGHLRAERPGRPVAGRSHRRGDAPTGIGPVRRRGGRAPALGPCRRPRSGGPVAVRDAQVAVGGVGGRGRRRVHRPAPARRRVHRLVRDEPRRPGCRSGRRRVRRGGAALAMAGSLRAAGVACGRRTRAGHHGAGTGGVRPSAVAGGRRHLPGPSRAGRPRRAVLLHVDHAPAVLRVPLPDRALRRCDAVLAVLLDGTRPRAAAARGDPGGARAGRPRAVRRGAPAVGRRWCALRSGWSPAPRSRV